MNAQEIIGKIRESLPRWRKWYPNDWSTVELPRRDLLTLVEEIERLQALVKTLRGGVADLQRQVSADLAEDPWANSVKWHPLTLATIGAMSRILKNEAERNRPALPAGHEAASPHMRALRETARASRCRRSALERDRLRQRVAELEAVVERLPKDSKGTPIVVGDTIRFHVSATESDTTAAAIFGLMNGEWYIDFGGKWFRAADCVVVPEDDRGNHEQENDHAD